MTIASKALVALFLALTGLLVGVYFGYDYAKTKGDAAMQEHLAADLRATETAELAARTHEYELAVAANDAAANYEKGRKDAQAEADKTAADLLAGNLRLQNHWAGCEAERLSDAATSASQLDAAKRRRAESAGRIIAAAAACDAQVRGLQAVLISERK